MQTVQLLDPKDGSITRLRNVGNCFPVDIAYHPRRFERYKVVKWSTNKHGYVNKIKHVKLSVAGNTGKQIFTDVILLR